MYALLLLSIICQGLDLMPLAESAPESCTICLNLCSLVLLISSDSLLLD